MASHAYQVLRGAVLIRQQVSFIYHGYRRECCPHTLGWTDGREQALVFQFAGGSATGLPPGGMWRCIKVSEILDITAHAGPWHTDPRHTQRQTCVKIVDVETFSQAA